MRKNKNLILQMGFLLHIYMLVGVTRWFNISSISWNTPKTGCDHSHRTDPHSCRQLV